MSHLPTERLAALADEPPTPAELAHLSACASCAREREAYRRLVERAAADSARIDAPLTSWEALAAALSADGVMTSSPASAGIMARPAEPGSRAELLRVGQHTGGAPRRVAWGRAAAATLLLGTGIAAGRFTAQVGPRPVVTAVAPAAGGASNVAFMDTAARFASIEDARAAQNRAQLVYQSATAYLAQRDSSVRPVDSPAAMRARLAALDRAHEVMGEALTAAPYDPVINSYYLNTAGQREATLRQLNTALPASMRIMSY